MMRGAASLAMKASGVEGDRSIVVCRLGSEDGEVDDDHDDHDDGNEVASTRGGGKARVKASSDA